MVLRNLCMYISGPELEAYGQDHAVFANYFAHRILVQSPAVYRFGRTE